MSGRTRRLWTLQPSRFAALSRGRARLAWLALLLLLLASLTALAVPSLTGTGDAAAHIADRMTDIGLYERVVAAMKGGDGYYVAASDAMRSGGYPLHPFLTMRLPALAALEAAIPGWASIVLLLALATLTAFAWASRVGIALAGLFPRAVMMLLLAVSMLAFFQPGLVLFHEVWAGLLVAVSLAVRRPGRAIEAIALGLAAMLIRETAALYVVVMLVFAWGESRRREALGWAIALLLFGAVLALHAHAVASVTGPLDAASAGWAGLNGPGFFLRALVTATALQVLPAVVGVLLVTLALFGWASWDDALGLRMFALLVAYGVMISIFARLDNFYWALMIAPAALLGLVFVPDALADLWHRALDRRRITVTTVTP
ncbi:hypothetical protein [Sphingomonas sp. TDK1]|uniref:hypothetical protein n=1 Tax=Sphingomonas sp. TDK1 TaxID=453247 RepID=UPI0007DA2061|nr:hypothetical protein [Sphingomonas sp. TDK1]OAN66625.1 hypothetical protein A7X12_10915 [Sphingomonas sp. TDK1]